jgi:hypothetical protein
MQELSSIEQKWGELSRTRLSWAHQAYDQFIANLDPEIGSRFARGDAQREAYVVVFGKTQVGKTTLILDLMGLSSEGLSKASKVLRGGRTTGKSATATAMEYRQSDDAHWKLTHSGQQEKSKSYDDAQMQKELEGIRTLMSNKQLLETASPVIVWIPNSYFEKKDAKFSVRMLDLPGDKPEDAVEQAHVNAMAQKYVPDADLILLVGRADDLGFLKPADLELPSIENWQIQPNRFRIITTYTYKLQTIRSEIKKIEKLDVNFFRERLLSQISTYKECKLTDNAKKLELYFPLEFGDSWNSASQADPDFVEKVEPVILSLKEELRKAIQESATPNARLRGALTAHVTVTNYKKITLEKMDVELDKLRKKIKKENDKEILLKNQLIEKNKEMENHKKIITDIKISKESLSLDVNFDLAKDFNEFCLSTWNIGEDTKFFTRTMTEVTSTFVNQAINWRPSFDNSDLNSKFWRSIKSKLIDITKKKDVENIIIKNFSKLRDKINGYSLSGYSPNSWFGSEFEVDKHLLRVGIVSSFEDVKIWIVEKWYQSATKKYQEFVTALEDFCVERDLLEGEVKNHKKAFKIINNQCDKLITDKDDFELRMRKNEKQSQEFIALLNKEYSNELANRKNIFKKISPANSFIELLAINQLIIEVIAEV